jgi:hypothetical protein
MLIGLAGVTSTGKTTIATAIKERYGDRINIIEKISRKEILDYVEERFEYKKGTFTGVNDLTLLSEDDRASFDIGRVELQMKAEDAFAQNSDRPTIIDGCTLVKIAYLIYLSAPAIVQYLGEDMLTSIIEKGLEHCNKYYSSIFYLPVTRLPFKEADHRLFKNEYIRTGQDAILNRLMTTKLRRVAIDLVTFGNTDMNLVFDELSKMGVK